MQQSLSPPRDAAFIHAGSEMSNQLSIRFVTHQDYEQWLPLWDGYNAFYGRSGPAALRPEITAMTWSRFFDAYEPMHALVAEHDGKLVGLTHYLFHRSTISIAPNCYLQDLFTSEAARGQGVGRAIMQRSLTCLKAAGIVRVLLLVSADNPGGRSFWLREGWENMPFAKPMGIDL